MRRKLVLSLCLVWLGSMVATAQFIPAAKEKAHDFEGVTVDGRPYHLYDSQAERIIICFWSADCDECHHFLKSLRKHVDLKHDYELVTFALADSAKEVRKKTRRMRLKGWHFYDPAGWDSQPFLEYEVNITPTAILIDKEKNIVGEAYDWEELEALREKNKSSKQ